MNHDGLKDRHRNRIVEILSSNSRVERAVLFGSRATGRHKPASDVDLALFGRDLTLDDLAELSDQIDQTAMPQRADLVLHHRIKNPELLDHIRNEGAEWYRRRDSAPTANERQFKK